jgi:hypothetical protein
MSSPGEIEDIEAILPRGAHLHHGASGTPHGLEPGRQKAIDRGPGEIRLDENLPFPAAVP